MTTTKNPTTATELDALAHNCAAAADIIRATHEQGHDSQQHIAALAHGHDTLSAAEHDGAPLVVHAAMSDNDATQEASQRYGAAARTLAALLN